MLSLFPIRASFPLTPLQGVEGRSLECLRRIGAMDAARLVISASPSDIEDHVSAGSPLTISWSGAGTGDAFVGYVHSFRPVSDGYTKRSLILAVSAAYPMLNETSRTMNQVAIDNVAQEVGDDHRFQVETDPHMLVQEQVFQGDESDWALLSRLARQWGYILLFEGVTLIFRPLLDVLGERIQVAEDERTDLSISPTGSNILTFSPSFTAAGRIPVTTTHSSGIGYNTQEIPRRETRPGVFDEIITNRSIATDLEGESVAIAEEVGQRFPFTAKAKVLFPAGKKPLDAYRITHNGKRMVWAVQEVRHIVTGGEYFAEMVLGSDGEDAAEGLSGLDVGTLLKNRKRAARPRPVIRDTKQFYAGSGASILSKDQRWQADVIRLAPREGT